MPNATESVEVPPWCGRPKRHSPHVGCDGSGLFDGTPEPPHPFTTIEAREKKMLRVKIMPDQEVMETIRQFLEKHAVNAGALIVVGAVDRARLSTMPRDDPRRDIITEYTEPLEMHGVGMITNGAPHIHCTLAREGDVGLAGHLHSAWVDAWFVDVCVIPMRSTRSHRPTRVAAQTGNAPIYQEISMDRRGPVTR